MKPHRWKKDISVGRSCSFLARLAICFVWVLCLSVIAHASSYKLGSQDRLKIRIVEWQVVEGTFLEWPAVSGEYTVDTAGMLSLPFAGQLAVAGKTTAEVAEVIRAKLQQKFGMTEKPEASVELIEYRPVFVAGDVREPGSFPYSPDLTVLKAVTLAGGTSNISKKRTERELIDARGKLDVLGNERLYLLVKRARLQSEVRGEKEISLPQEVAQRAKYQAVKADEQAILSVRRKKLELQLQALSDLRELLEFEIETMEKKVVTQERQIALANEELLRVDSLAKKGLVVSTRLLSSERTIADMEGRLLDLETAILRAKQDISKTTQDEINIRNSFETELVTEQQDVEAKITEVSMKMQTQMNLLTDTLSVSKAQSLYGLNPGTVEYFLVQKIDGKIVESTANEHSAVNPGDVVKVMLKPPADAQMSIEQN